MTELTDSALRIKAAEFCGWKYYRNQGDIDDRFYGGPNQLDISESVPSFILPDYLNDKNAAFTLVDVLKGEGWDFRIGNDYGNGKELFCCFTKGTFLSFTATSDSLCHAITEAFCKVKESTK